jgi:hypothetical protein
MSIRSTLAASVTRHGHYAAPIAEQGICWVDSAASVKTVNLALQGGGAHGAFAWGVLERLLEDERIVLDGSAQRTPGCSAQRGSLRVWPSADKPAPNGR